MSEVPPLRFEPIYQYRIWSGRRLADLLSAPLQGDEPVGEAWVLSDHDDHQSQIASGPLEGQTIAKLLEQFPEQVMATLAERFRRFPLLLKFLDAREMLPGGYIPTIFTRIYCRWGHRKDRSLVVLEAGMKNRIYAGLKPGTTEADLRRWRTVR